MKEIKKLYNGVKKLVKNNQHTSDEMVGLYEAIYNQSQTILGCCSRQDLTSKVPNKNYFAFEDRGKLSRAINSDLYQNGLDVIQPFFDSVYLNDFSKVSPHQITAACYRIAISFCAVIDLKKNRDQRTPGTLFEYFVGSLFARRLGVVPTKKLDVLNLDMKASLPTDFVFDLGKDSAKLHVPVKTSTRERVIQVWAHQRVLDGVYGAGRFLGTLACLAETKKDNEKLEVVEICLPTQWRLYQMHIAKLHRVYYLDKPNAYEALNNVYPKIDIIDFGEFFFEVDELVG